MYDGQKQMRIFCLNPLVAYFSTENVRLIRFTNQFSNIKLKNLLTNVLPRSKNVNQ